MAITRHVVDGCLDPWHMVPALRLNDLLKTHTEFSDWSLSTTTFVLAMNKTAYERLPRELKNVIDNNSGQLAAGMAGTMWDMQAEAVAEMVAQSGDVIVTLLPEAVAHWRKATEPVIDGVAQGHEGAEGRRRQARSPARMRCWRNMQACLNRNRRKLRRRRSRRPVSRSRRHRPMQI